MRLPNWLRRHRKAEAPAKLLSERQNRPRLIVRRGTGRQAVGRYDAAETTDDNVRHWRPADSSSADAANSYVVRKKLRERSRYESSNNTYLQGIADTYSRDVVGQRGPHLQLLTDDVDLNQKVEREWQKWAAKAHLGRKLRTLQRARVVDGEGFALFVSNERLGHPVRLDLRLYECDHIHYPGLLSQKNNIDGVLLDGGGNPIAYQFLHQHPGGAELGVKYTEWEADRVLHWFVHVRAGQHRGVPVITAALPLAAYERRYRLAVISAAETAASFAAILYTDAPAGGEAAEIDEFDAVEIEKNMMVTMPGGWKMDQFDPRQPPSTYVDFKRENITDMGRPVSMPRNIASGDSSDYNFASGRLDHGTYYRNVALVQGDMGDEIVDPILSEWIKEARRLFRWGKLDLDVDHEWLWQQREAIDPREAKAEAERLSSGAVTLPELYAARGKDWRVELVKGADALGIDLKEYQALIRKKLFNSSAAVAASVAEAVAAGHWTWEEINRELEIENARTRT